MIEIDVIIATFNREDSIIEAIENVLQYRNDVRKFIIVVNGSDDNTLEYLNKYSGDEKIEIISSKTNLGASGGKNLGMRRSTADLLVILDDDAEFYSANPFEEIRNIFNENDRVGLIQFSIVNYHTKKIKKHEFPGKSIFLKSDKEFLISSYTGAGHAIRKTMLDSIGYYDELFFYAHEELDLSFRIIENGWDMKYVPTIKIYHKVSPKGRLPGKRVIEMMMMNRMIISYRYLPFKYFLISSILWFLKSTLWSKSILLPIKITTNFIKEMKSIDRKIISKRTINYMKKNNGRLWY